jgi:hypothetical protein
VSAIGVGKQVPIPVDREREPLLIGSSPRALLDIDRGPLSSWTAKTEAVELELRQQ